MASVVSPKTPPTAAEVPTSVQPGGFGFFVHCELAWGRFRRGMLRRFFPGHVERWQKLRQGECQDCRHDIIDPRDLKFVRNACGYKFRPEDDGYSYRERLGFARYGYAELVGFGVILIGIVLICGWLGDHVHRLFDVLGIVAFVLWLFVISFFRDPPRRIPTDVDALFSPADGTVTHVEKVDDPEMGPVLRVSIFLSIFNVHVNRVPRAGRVTAVRYFRGEYLDARHGDCHVRNEQLWLDFVDAATGQPIRVKQISGAIARRIVCVLKSGDEVAAGDRFGMIKFGSRTDVLLPAGKVKDVIVKVGEKVRGGKTILLRVS
jgi:phosphatidylserine decarboxylase